MTEIGPGSLSCIGLLLFGYIGDSKGRKLAFKLSWRFYTIGLMFLTFTKTPFLISFGYFLACTCCFASLVIQFVLLFEQISPEIRIYACYLLLTFLLIAPLFASFLANVLVDIGRVWTLTILCTVPSIILSLVTGYVEESALFVYKNSKLHAFNVLNKIAKINGSLPFIIDLSRSYWRKLNFYEPSLVNLIQHEPTRLKLLLGIFFCFGFYFNRLSAQIQLNPVTDVYQRGMLMNISSAVATLTVIIIFSKWKFHNFRLATFLTPFILLLSLLVTYLNCNSLPFVYAISISLRYVSDIGFSIFLIWAIEAYPTVCRTRCVGMVFCGISLGTSLAYALGAYPLVQMGIGLVVSLLAVWASKYLRLDHRHRLKDTLSNKDYDRQDQFRRVCKGEE